MSNHTKDLTCQERVKDSMNRRLNDLRVLFQGVEFDDCVFKLDNQGGLTITVSDDYDYEYGRDEVEDYIRPMEDELDKEAFFEYAEDDINEDLQEKQGDYGLCFDYVAPETFTGQPEGFFRYQLSTGGPGDEFRFFVNPDFSVHRIEYWFLDWFDGANVVLQGDDYGLLKTIFEDFKDCGSVEYAFEQATK